MGSPVPAPDNRSDNARAPRRLGSETEISLAIRQLLRRDDGGPVQPMAIRGLALGLAELAAWMPQVAALQAAVESAAERAEALCPAGSAGLDVLPSEARTRIYEAAINLAHAEQRQWAPDKLVAALVATWAVHGLITGAWPRDERVAKASNAVRVPHSTASLLWTEEQRLNALLRALRNLQVGLGENPSLAAGYGLAPELSGPPKPPPTGIAGFNLLLLAHRAALNRRATKKDRGAGGGHGVLSLNEVLRVGESQLAEFELGVPRGVYAYLQGRSELTAQLAELLPVQLGDTPPPGALAWLDMPNQHYCARLAKIEEDGAQPFAGTADLYLETDQVVRRPLLLAVAQIIKEKAEANSAAWLETGWCPLHQLLGRCAYQRLDKLYEAGVPGATVRRMQRSLTAHLINAGHARWPVALVLHNSQIITGAREYYAACRTEWLDDVHAAMNTLLGWPAPPRLPAGGLVGAFVSVDAQNIKTVLDSFAAAADRAVDMASVDGIVTRINRHAEWLLVMMALCLALRQWGVYDISPRELSRALETVFCDKKVHSDAEAPVPVVEPLRQAACAWLALLEACIARLEIIQSPEALALATALRAEHERSDGGDRVFTVGADLQLRRAGTRAWAQRLPGALRVVDNFGRHFWPLVLGDLGLPQLWVDVLLRQQLAGLHSGTEARGGTRHADTASLRAAMEKVLRQMNLTRPCAMKGGVL